MLGHDDFHDDTPNYSAIIPAETLTFQSLKFPHGALIFFLKRYWLQKFPPKRCCLEMPSPLWSSFSFIKNVSVVYEMKA